MKDRKGFTLIELLVAITIIGIIMLMTLPAIHNLQRENQKKKFDDYERTVLEAAKAYEDQYEEDLYGRNSDGCAAIKFSSLVNTKLLATTKISGYECNNNQNGVIIRKIHGTSYYEVYLSCDKGGEMKNLTSNTDFVRDSSQTYCKTGDDIEKPTFNIDCGNIDLSNNQIGKEADDDNKQYDSEHKEILYYSAPTENNNNVGTLPNLNTSALDDKSGLEKNQFITYEWKITKRSDTNEEYKEKNKSTYNTKDGTKAYVQKAIRITEPIKKIDTTGKAEIYITGENIVDRAGNRLETTDSTATKTCTYYYDNARPIMKITVTGERTGTNYNQETSDWINEPVTIRIDITDKINDNNIYVGIKEDTFTNNGERKTLNKNGSNPTTYIYELNGETNKIINDEYKVCDKLGNCESQRVSLKIDSELPTCTITGDGNWDPDGARVTINCYDPVISGVRTCAGINGTSRTVNIKEDVEWTVEDNAGNSNTCTYHVESTTQYYQVTCRRYNSCRDNTCPTERYISSYTVQFVGPTGAHIDTCRDYCCGMSYPSPCISSTPNYATRHSICPAEGCGCNIWNTNGTWKFDSCSSNSCRVDRTRLVYK